MLGPLAVDVNGAGVEGLLLAGDAAGFIDPMTGDGLRLALRGGEIAAAAALESLEGRSTRTCGWPSAAGTSWAPNFASIDCSGRWSRGPSASTAAACASVWPSLLVRLIAYAGDVPAT